MTLQELSDTLLPSFPPSVQKDVKTAVRVLAKALQCPDPQQCPLDQFNRPLPSLYRLIESVLIAQGKGPHTIRNTKNHLSRLFRLAEKQQLFSLVPLPPTPRYALDTRPFRPGSDGARNNGTYLPVADWPPDLQNAFTAFVTWATAPVVAGRPASLQKRLTTMRGYRVAFEAYFGFLTHVQHVPTLQFDQLFDLTLVTAFVHWHINEVHHRVTSTIHNILMKLLTITRQYYPLPEFRTQLIALKKTLPPSHPTYDKNDAWVSLDTLDEIGRAHWPQTPPDALLQRPFNTGSKAALRACRSLMLRLWRFVPLRQRNIREMKLDEHLYKDAEGRWHLTFRGEHLKIARRRGRLNTFTVAFPETLVPFLEDYLRLWRPLLLKKASQPSTHVFLTERGTPYQSRLLTQCTQNIVYRYTGKHWHPHIIRTVWATEMIQKGLDFVSVAEMLNDRLETVIANYAHLRNENFAEKAYRLIEEVPLNMSGTLQPFPAKAYAIENK
jgi:hypothetical protein